MQWGNVSNLTAITDDATGIQYTYKYNDQGIRTEKVVNGVVHKYYLQGEQIIAERYGNNLIKFYYDATGVCGFNYNGTDYYYLKNIQGDILKIYDNSGVLYAEYSYDAWGKCTIKSNVNNIAAINPFRYRGYYYDTETELYYLNARYYDPEIGRFISPDGTEYLEPETINGLNLYAYCGNNPVMYMDPAGTSWASFWSSVGNWFKSNWEKVVSVVEIVAGTVALFIPGGQAVGSVLLSMGITSMVSGYANELSGGAFLSGWVGGQISGLFAAIPGLSTVASAIMGFIGGFIGSATTGIMDNILYNRGLSMSTIIISSLFAGLINTVFTIATPKPAFGIKYGSRSFVPAVFGYMYYANLVWGTRGFLVGVFSGFFPNIDQ